MEWEKVTIQKMDIQDLDEVISVESSSSGAPWSKGMFVEEMRNPFACCFVMKIEDQPRQRVIGFICFRNVAEESELLNICVHSDYRQLGAGRKLMEFYVEFCRRRGIKTFHLEVQFFKSLGDPSLSDVFLRSIGDEEKILSGKV